MTQQSGQLEALKSAALPLVGDRYIWMPHSDDARETVLVTDVTWNGEDWWVECQNEVEGKPALNELSRWIEATVYLSPGLKPQIGYWATHKSHRLDPRQVVDVSDDGQFIKIKLITNVTDWIPAENYTFREGWVQVHEQ